MDSILKRRMSSATYDEIWRIGQTLLAETIQTDTVLQGAKAQKDRRKAHDVVSALYVRYILACNKLERCYDQAIQPQKRLLMKRLLDASLGRVLELKHELVDIDLSEHSYYDDALIECGVTPQEAEIRIPSYYRRDRIAEIEKRRKFIEDTLRNTGALHEIAVPTKITESQAIRLIQVRAFRALSQISSNIDLYYLKDTQYRYIAFLFSPKDSLSVSCT